MVISSRNISNRFPGPGSRRLRLGHLPSAGNTGSALCAIAVASVANDLTHRSGSAARKLIMSRPIPMRLPTGSAVPDACLRSCHVRRVRRRSGLKDGVLDFHC